MLGEDKINTCLQTKFEGQSYSGRCMYVDLYVQMTALSN